MELSVAVDKLNSMSREEILSEAMELPMVHEVGNPRHCVIANLLEHWGVHNPGVTHHYASTNMTDIVELPYHVSRIAADFDKGFI